MIKTAIIEDEEQPYETLKGFLEAFGKENSISFQVTRFNEGLSFLEENEAFDLVFMDIELPHMNGMDVATKFREKDKNAAIIFVTNMVQYAIRGYAVDAIDYVLKPIQWNRFCSLMMKTIRIIGVHQEQEIILKTTEGIQKIPLNDIVSIEINDHLLIYHLVHKEIEAWGTLSNAEKDLPSDRFCRCNNSTIINISKVVSYDKYNIYLTEERVCVPISRSKRKAVLLLLSQQMRI